MQRKNIISLNLKNFLIDYIKPFAYIIYNQNFKKFPKKLDTINVPNDIIYKFNTETKKVSWVNKTTKERGRGLLRRTGY